MNFDDINKALWMTDIASEHGAVSNHMLAVLHWFMGLLTVGWGLFLIYILWRFRAKKQPKASYHGVTSHFSTHLEIAVVIIEVVLLLGFAFPLWATRVDDMPKDDPNAIRIRAVGEQFRWTFQYTGPDKLMGLTDPFRIQAASNAIGLVSEDPNAKDDFTTINELVLPKGRPVIIQVTSKDVIHGLALVPMFIQQDAIPGREVPMWFIPSKTGEWDIVCAQLCGAGHAQMAATLKVVEPEEFDQWFASQQPMLPKQ
ncbi:MAG: cytochrome c oxidase subunit II [Verrucomicrobiae bacterium]|nr:cytochrome c oxidase subunit II [Verrucomicrobiae bacterium]MCB1089989.1 cytochrome c oxidase subunit II [Verrucomicrobiae bacterium]